MAKRRPPVPSYWRKNIAQHAERKYFRRKAQERQAAAAAGGKGEKA